MKAEEDGTTNQKTVSDVEIRPRVHEIRAVLPIEMNPVANGISMIDMDVSSMPYSKSIIQVAKNSGRDHRKRNGDEQIIAPTAEEQQIDENSKGNHRK